jgi:carbamoyl-phosphate synthase small subunit
LACGAKTLKMKFGHHGGNHPVQSLQDKKVMITSQNHGFAVDEKHIPECLEVTHRSLFDHTIQGIKHRSKPAYSFQGHPEAGPGPNDARILFNDFIQAMQLARKQESKQPSLSTVEMN